MASHDDLSDVQLLVYLAAQWTPDDVVEWRNTLMENAQESYGETIRQEVKSLGCSDPGNIVLGPGEELRALSERAQESAQSIVDTYNRDLINAIYAIGNEHPRANRHVYVANLREWFTERSRWKDDQISDTELAWVVSAAKQDFQFHNQLDFQAQVVPFPSVCPICQGYIEGNPYKNMDELYRKCDLPAHVSCPHVGEILNGQLDPQSCRELWIGV